MPHRFRKNIVLLYLFTIGQGLLFAIPVLKLFYNSIGLSLAELMLVQVIFACVITAFEVPSGYMADYFGRKKTLVIGATIVLIGWIVYGGAQTFFGVLAAEILLALGLSAISGLEETIFFDSLLLLKEEDTYKKVDGTSRMWNQISEATGSVIGGVIAAVSLRYPFYLQIIACALAIVPVLFIKEPPRKQITGHHGANMKQAWNTIAHNRGLTWLTIAGGVIAATTFASVWFTQGYFEIVALPIKWYGIAWALSNLAAALGSHLSHRLEKHGNEHTHLIAILTLALIALIGMAVVRSPIGLIFILAPRAAWGLLAPLTQTIANRHIDSGLRATVLSLKSLIERLIFIVIGTLYAYLIKVISLENTMLIAALVLITGGGIAIYKTIKSGILKPVPLS